MDPITFAVVKSALDAIVDEMAYTVIRTARSEIVKDVMDFSTALCDAEGRMVAQAKTIAQHLGAIPDAMASVLEQCRDDIHPGDVMILNDPYQGGMHLPDIFMFMPIFLDARLEGFSVVIAHHTDVGGRVAGSNASDSTEIYQEGLRLPVVKLYERGVPSQSVFRIIEKNVRVPGRVIGDLGSEYAACRVGERELVKLLTRYGADTARGYMRELLDYAERMTRSEIRGWPKGRFTFTDHLDSDGFDDTPIPITATITVHEDSLTVDYAGTSPQVKAALNSTLSFTKSCTYLSVRSVLEHGIPNNAGVFRCIEVRAPEASVVNPVLPAACAARALTGYRILDVMMGALAQIVPHKVPAAGEGGNTVVCIGGYQGNREPFIIVDMICGAWGGRPDKDGIEAVTNPSQNMSNTPVEVLEAQHPIRIDEYAFVPDSCGAGKWRGGLGLARQYTLLAEEATLQLRSDRMTFLPYGLDGGRPAAPTRNVLNRRGRPACCPPSSPPPCGAATCCATSSRAAGVTGIPSCASPPGWPRTSPTRRSRWSTPRHEHGVVIDPLSLEVDEAATRALRDGPDAAPGHGRS
jgi:N-methylhydantoinase B